MKKIFCLLFLLTCVGASHAATMCVPDFGLSTCESCTGFRELRDSIWYASCCGVGVYGVYFPMHGDFSTKRSVLTNKNDGADVVDLAGGQNRNFCLMLTPVVAPYMVQVSYNFAYTSSECTKFIPRCAFTYCDEDVELEQNSWW